MYILELLRTTHYIKNIFIFLPLFFALEITNIEKLIFSFMAFCFLSLIASAIYIFNDSVDLESDRQHPIKKMRPLASGKVPHATARAVMFLCGLCGLIGFFFLNREALIYSLLYIAINLGYSLKLKHIPILDIAIIAVGFVFRLFIGAAVTNVTLSLWIISMTFLLALFLALAKRRDDVFIFMRTGKKMRKVIDGYNLEFVNAAMTVMSAVVIVFYALYTVSQDVIAKVGSDKLYLTTFFVILGILRYMQITFVHGNSASPTQVLLKDSFIQATLVGWISLFGWIIYT